MPSSLGLEDMQILEYERRVKKFAITNPIVTFSQLRESFKGTNVFPYLDDTDSPTYKFLSAEFICDIDKFICWESDSRVPVEMKDTPKVHSNMLLLLGLIYCPDDSEGLEKTRIYY